VGDGRSGRGLRGLALPDATLRKQLAARGCEEKRREGNPAAEAAGLGCEGKSLESENPMGVTGMKQGRALGRGASRRKGEKPCGRNLPGEASRGEVDSPELMRRRGEELHESCRKAQ
jgi:hypothetical protein